MFLEVVPFAADVTGDFVAVGQTDPGDLSQSRIRLLRCRGIDARTHAALLRTGGQRRHVGLLGLARPGLSNKLINRRHCWFWSVCLSATKALPSLEFNPRKGGDSRQNRVFCQHFT